VNKRERERERERERGAKRIARSFLFSPAKSRRGDRERRGMVEAARGSARGVRWMEGKMDRELDLPNLPPR